MSCWITSGESRSPYSRLSNRLLSPAIIPSKRLSTYSITMHIGTQAVLCLSRLSVVNLVLNYMSTWTYRDYMAFSDKYTKTLGPVVKSNDCAYVRVKKVISDYDLNERASDGTYSNRPDVSSAPSMAGIRLLRNLGVRGRFEAPSSLLSTPVRLFLLSSRRPQAFCSAIDCSHTELHADRADQAHSAAVGIGSELRRRESLQAYIFASR